MTFLVWLFLGRIAEDGGHPNSGQEFILLPDVDDMMLDISNFMLII